MESQQTADSGIRDAMFSRIKITLRNMRRSNISRVISMDMIIMYKMTLTMENSFNNNIRRN